MTQFQRRTLSQLIDELSELVGDNTVYWTATEKRDALNEAICVWQAMTGQWVERTALDANSTFLRIPNDMISVQRVRVGTRGSDSNTAVGTPLTMTSLPELDYGSPGWDSAATGTPEMWAPVGINEIALYPTPPVSGVLIILEGLREAPRLFSDGDFIDMGEEEFQLLLHYAHHYLTFKEAGAEFNATQENLIGVVEGAALRNAKFKKRAPYRIWMGMLKDEGEAGSRAPATQVGVRSNE